MNLKVKTLILLLAATGFCSEIRAESAIYACGHIRRDRENAIPALKNSGYTTAIVFNVTVENDGTLTTDYDWNNQRPAEAGGIICRDGVYVFADYQPYFADDLKSLLVAPTSVSRIEFCIGGWGNGSYGNIRNLINTQGTGGNSVLYRNFKALKEAIPEVVAINNDQEQDYDVASATAFHKMLAEIGYKTTVAPYTQKQFWQQLVANLNADEEICDLVYLQTYGGGAGNNPNDWKVFGSLPMYVGFDNESNYSIAAMQNSFTGWRDSAPVSGGFIWNFNNNNHNLNQWATAINRIFPPVEGGEPVVKVYDKTRFGGNSYELPEGEFSQGQMSLYGVQGNEICSLEIKEGYSITLYTGETFNGQSVTFDKNSSNIGTPWLQKVCSVKIQPSDDAGVSDVPVFRERKVEIYDIYGRKVVEKVTSECAFESVSSAEIPSGLYIVRAGGESMKIRKD